MTVFTVVSPDHYQYYIPMFCFCVLRAYPDARIVIGVRGPIDSVITEGLSDRVHLHEHWRPDITQYQASTTNCLRFIDCPMGEVIVTDVDLLWFKPRDYDHWDWHRQGGFYHGHHGPYKRPYRPEVSAEGWTGDYERVAGGFFYYRDPWASRTAAARRKWGDALARGDWGAFREADEVMLARIIKESNLKVPRAKFFPPELRGLHLGDFKESMTHRWTDIPTMRGKLTDETVQQWMDLNRDQEFAEVREKMCTHNVTIMYIMSNVDTHMKARVARMRR